MTQRNYLTSWKNEGERIKLQFLDGSILFVAKADFDRAFGGIVSLTKEDVESKFTVLDEADRVITAKMLNHYLSYLATVRSTNSTIPVSDVTFTLSDLQETVRDIQTASQRYLQYRADMMDKSGGLRELFG